MSRLEEQIVVAPRSQVFANERLAFHGFLPLADPRAPQVVAGLAERPFLARRGAVEEDPSLLQPIPYVVVVRERGGSREMFAYTRLTGGGESRLHGRMSIGVGGHMNHLFDSETLEAVVALEAARELAEELHFRDGSGLDADPPPVRLLGLINDDTGPVQRVHIGLVAIAEVPADWMVEVRETERLEGSWVTTEALDRSSARLEEWSLHALAGLGAADQPPSAAGEDPSSKV